MRECLPNKRVLERVWQIFSCLFIQFTVICAFVKYTGCEDAALECGMLQWSWLLSLCCFRVRYAAVKLTVVTVLPDPCVTLGQCGCEGEVSSELQLCKWGATQETCTSQANKRACWLLGTQQKVVGTWLVWKLCSGATCVASVFVHCTVTKQTDAPILFK
jgi:hypothetical protein